MSESEDYLCADCGCDLTTDGFIQCICPACGGTNALPINLYTAQQPDPEISGPSKHAVYDPESESFTIAEEDNPGGWARALNDAGIMELGR